MLSERPDRLHYSRKVEIVYNQAIALLHAGQIEQAFHNFQTCVTVYRSHPQLWLHLAECCIVACSEPCEHAQQMLKRREASEATEKDLMRLSFQILETPHSQKYILNTAAQRHSSLYNQGDGHSATKPALTLPFAYSCLRNAHAILCKHESEPNVPNPLPVTSKLYLVKAVVLIKLSYVALRVGDPFMAAKYSQEVLMKHTQIPGGHLALAKLYAAESMIQLDKMSEAIELLDPKTIEDVGFECDAAGKDPSPEEKASRCTAHVSAQEALAATRAIFNFNLAVAYMQRGELSKADELLKDLWESRAEHQIGTKVFTAQLYSHLKRGNIKECRESIRKRCLKYF